MSATKLSPAESPTSVDPRSPWRSKSQEQLPGSRLHLRDKQSLLRPSDVQSAQLQALLDRHHGELAEMLNVLVQEAVTPYRDEIAQLKAAMLGESDFVNTFSTRKKSGRKPTIGIDLLTSGGSSNRPTPRKQTVARANMPCVNINVERNVNTELTAERGMERRASQDQPSRPSGTIRAPSDEDFQCKQNSVVTRHFPIAAQLFSEGLFSNPSASQPDFARRGPGEARGGTGGASPKSTNRLGRHASQLAALRGITDAKRARFMKYFKVVSSEKRCLSPEDLHSVVCMRGVKQFTMPMACITLRELERVAGVDEGCLEVEILADIITDPAAAGMVPAEMKQTVRDLQVLLVTEDVEDSIDKVSGIEAFRNKTGASNARERFLAQVQVGFSFMVSMAIIVSTITLGLALDVEPDWIGWLAMETIFTVIFLVELGVRLYSKGCRAFFKVTWNQIDSAVTVIAATQTATELAWTALASDMDTSGLRLTLMLRVLRVVRVTRLVKLLQMPFFAEFSTMINGLLIGMSPLASVMFLLCILIYIYAIICRSTIGPREGQDYFATCGSADNLAPDHDEELCPAHLIYGEEYFHSVAVSMFRVFSCLSGDCITKAGRSLPEIFAEGYGWRFSVPYTLGMMSTIFGVFNIITAKFIDTTMTGIKYNETQRRFAEMYEASYVRSKLQQFVERVSMLSRSTTKGRKSRWGGRVQSFSGGQNEFPQEDFLLSRSDLAAIIEDPFARNILSDLDINCMRNEDFLDILDIEGNGETFLHDVILTLGKLRGGLSKFDMVAPTVQIAALTRKLDEVDNKVASIFLLTDDHLNDSLANGPVEMPRAVSQDSAVAPPSPLLSRRVDIGSFGNPAYGSRVGEEPRGSEEHNEYDEETMKRKRTL